MNIYGWNNEKEMSRLRRELREHFGVSPRYDIYKLLQEKGIPKFLQKIRSDLYMDHTRFNSWGVAGTDFYIQIDLEELDVPSKLKSRILNKLESA